MNQVQVFAEVSVWVGTAFGASKTLNATTLISISLVRSDFPETVEKYLLLVMGREV